MEKAYFLGAGSHDGLDPLDVFSLLGEMEIGIYFPKWGAAYQAGFEQKFEEPSRDLVFVGFDRDARKKVPFRSGYPRSDLLAIIHSDGLITVIDREAELELSRRQETLEKRILEASQTQPSRPQLL